MAIPTVRIRSAGPTPVPVPASGVRAARQATLAVVLPPALLALALGLWGLRRKDSIWGDEAVSLEVARRSTGQIWQLTQHIDAVHGLYYLLLHLLFTLHDGGLATLRLPSVLGMTAAAAGVALIGRRLSGSRAGLAAGLVFCVFPAVQEYAQEGRSYGMVCAGVVGSGLLLLRAAERPTVSRWSGYALAALTTCVLHEFAVLAVLGQGLTLVLARQSRRVRLGWLAACAGVLAGLLPLALLSESEAAQVAWITAPGTGTVLFALGTMLVGALCALVAGPGQRAFALPLLVLPQMVLLLVSVVHPVYLDRYVVFEYAGLALLIGAALDRLGRRAGWRVLLVVPLALLLLLPVETGLRTPQSRPDDLAAAARAVGRMSAPGDGVLFLPSARRQSELAFPADYAGRIDLALSGNVAASDTLGGIELPPDGIRARLLAVTRVVTVRTAGKGVPEGTAQDREKLAVLGADFQVCARAEVRGLVVTAYARPGDCRAG